MRVEITDRALLSAATDCGDVLLLAIFAMGLVERHRVFVSDPEILSAWAPTARPGLIRDEVELALRTSEQADAQGTGRIHTIIVDDTPAEQWSLPADDGEHLARLRPGSALSLLGRPLRVLLENGRNDRDFLLAFCSAAQRHELEGAARRGWLDFSTAGGINSLSAILDEEEEQLERLLRTIAIADSDALSPGAPSELAESVQARIDRISVQLGLGASAFGHVLKGRSAESYIPPGPLKRWASTQAGSEQAHSILQQATTPRGLAALAARPGKRGSARRTLLAAIAWQQLSETQRKHIDAKKGLGGNNAPDLTNDLSEYQRSVLQHGFGGGLSRRFYPSQHQLPDPSGEIPRLLALLSSRL